MITHIEIAGFKSLQKVSLDLGGLNVFVGTNASGKSNFFDALRVLQGIAYGFSIDEVFNGKPKGANSEVWEPIRGGLGNAHFREWTSADNLDPAYIRFLVRLQSPRLSGDLEYEISIYQNHGKVYGERLGLSNGPRISTFGDVSFDHSRSAMHQFLKTRQCT